MVLLSHLYMITGKTIALTRWTFVGKVMSLLFNMLSRLVRAFLPRSRRLLISWLRSLSPVILEPKKIVCHLFQSCGHCWVFQICWHIECNTLTESSFRIWSILAGILSPPLALFIVMLPKVHLTSHCRVSGFRWVTTPSWLSRSLISVLHNSSVYSCHLF